MISFNIGNRPLTLDVNYNRPLWILYINTYNEQHNIKSNHPNIRVIASLLLSRFKIGILPTPKSFDYTNEKVLIKITINNNTLKNKKSCQNYNMKKSRM